MKVIIMDDVNMVIEKIFGKGIGNFYCSSKVSWKLAESIDWLRGAIIEALTRPDARIFYMLTIYHELLNIMALCRDELASIISGKTPYQLLYDSKVISIIENMKKGCL